jgi:hypothetical protein
MFIQEALFTCFSLAFVIAIGRMTMGGGLAWSAAAGLAAGLAVATKETSLIVLPAGVAACALAWMSLGPARRQPVADEIRWAAAGIGVAAVVAALFFSSFLSFPAGVLAAIGAIGTYLERGVDPANHAHPWHYYLGLLAYHSSGGLRWSEGLVLALAGVAAISAFRAPAPSRPERAFWTRCLVIYVLLSGAVFSIIRYKTPWNLLPFYAGAVALAGIGFSTLLRSCSSCALRAALVAGLVLGSGHLAWQARRASVTYAADPRNPYVYAQSVPDTVRMATRIRNLAAVHPDGDGMLVAVVAPPHEQWPLPWYLRAMPHVGYWTTPADALALQPPVVVASMEHTAVLDEALGERYVSEFYGLRPDVLLALYVERGLWERFLARAADSGPTSEPSVR